MITHTASPLYKFYRNINFSNHFTPSGLLILQAYQPFGL
ncbi:MAG: hypothetical protein JETT_0457 [Candidatus Jettenia ecosi]|uniref:Uncharacterized protein n=1 Tax=Candidatus Jettenia ecosi TaxID=2494326 RepID=A0A533QEU7_9BACT|nr:MAG: hypothetical protein JETT_0457 [Candidatus Jettenia ecosi]